MWSYKNIVRWAVNVLRCLNPRTDAAGASPTRAKGLPPPANEPSFLPGARVCIKAFLCETLKGVSTRELVFLVLVLVRRSWCCLVLTLVW